MNDKDILEQREKEYGDATESFSRIAGMWSSYIGIIIEPHQVANMMVLLKISRTTTSTGDTLKDCYLDGRNYLTLAEGLYK